MIRFEVTGATPEEFAEQIFRTLGVQINLYQAAATEPVSAQPAIAANSGGLSPPPTSPTSTTSSSPLKAQTCGSENSSTALKADPTDADVDAAMEMQRRGAIIGQKIEERKKVHSDPVNDLFVPETESPASGSTTDPQPAKNSKPSSKAKGPKLDDLKTRLSEVIVAATERWDQKRANAYARKLLEEFYVPKLSDLAALEYPRFMMVSEAYRDGTIEE